MNNNVHVRNITKKVDVYYYSIDNHTSGNKIIRIDLLDLNSNKLVFARIDKKDNETIEFWVWNNDIKKRITKDISYWLGIKYLIDTDIDTLIGEAYRVLSELYDELRGSAI